MSQKNGHTEDEEYFKSYADMSIHLDMIHDEVRTKTYRYAILKNFDVFYKKVVMDVGAGTGILSMFCVQAGASKVYAVEASDMAFEAEKVIKDNGMEDRIEVIKSKVEDVTLDEKVDVIVSEWMGHLLFFESMLPSVLHARDKFLKEGGFMFPSNASISLAVLADDEVDMDGSNVWDMVKTSYSLNMNSLRSKSLRCFTERVHVLPVDPRHVVAFPVEVLNVDLRTVPAESLERSLCKSDFSFNSFGSAKVNGFCAFFDVTFRGNIVLTTSPYKELTHWQQSVMYLKNQLQVEQDDLIKGTISIGPSPNSRRGLSVHLEYESLTNGQRTEAVGQRQQVYHQTFLMDGQTS